MKTKRILAFTLALVMIFSVICSVAIPASALTITNNITKVHVNVPGAEAGKTVNNSPSTITWVDNKNHYEITAIQWYKESYDQDHKMNNGEVFLGGNRYFMELIARTKGDHTWPTEFDDLNNMDLKINPGTSKEATPMRIQLGTVVDPKAENYLRIAYKFEMIPDGVVYYPSVKLDTPVAGNKADYQLDITNPFIKQDGSISWYKMTEKGWQYIASMQEKFVAGNTYRAVFGIYTVDGMIFDVPATPSTETLYVKGLFNGSSIHYIVNRDDYNIAQNRLKLTVDFTSTKTQEITSVSFDNVTAPVVGNKPLFDSSSITLGDSSYAIDSEYADEGYVNGISWYDGNGKPMNENDVFENGKKYTLAFTLKSDVAHSFTEFVQASSSEGFAETVVDPLDSTTCYVAITFDCRNDGELTNVSMGNIKSPVHGNLIYIDNPTLGQGYHVDGEIEWFDVTDPENPQKKLNTDVFEYGKVYSLRVPIVIFTNTDFTFADSMTASVKGAKSAKCEKISDTEAVIVAEFDVAQGKFQSNIGFNIETPLEGSPFSEKVIIDGSLNEIIRIVKAEWYSDGSNDPMSADDRFEADVNYYLQIVVDLADGSYYLHDGVTASVNGINADFTLLSPDLGFVNYTFQAEKLPEVIINFEIGDAMGDIDTIAAKPGTEIELPTFDGCTAPAGFKFAGWSLYENTNKVFSDEKYTVPNTTLPVNFYAVYVPEDNNDLASHIHVYSDTRVDFNQGDFGQCGYECVLEDCPDPDLGRTDLNQLPEQQGQHQYGENATWCDEVCIKCGHVRTVNQDGGPLHFFYSDCQENCSVCGKHREISVNHTPGAEATCTENQTCTVCSVVLAFAIGHEYGDPTCESAGICTHDGCNESIGSPIGHTAGVAATCTDPQTCTVCSATLVPALGHTPGAAATCTDPQLCTVCTAQIKPAKGHTPAGAATCTEASKCSECAAVLGEALGHTFGDSYLNDENEHYKLCACGARGEVSAHADSDGDNKCDACGYDMYKGLGAGAIVAIVIGSVVLVGGGGFCLYWFVIRKRR